VGKEDNKKMEYKINKEEKTITIFDSAGKVDEIKSIMSLFPDYTLKTGVPKQECVCNPAKGGDGICKCE
jgi:hypothetical protein